MNDFEELLSKVEEFARSIGWRAVYQPSMENDAYIRIHFYPDEQAESPPPLGIHVSDGVGAKSKMGG